MIRAVALAMLGVALPAGEWRITAIANFTEDSECRGIPHVLSIPVTITVVD